MKEVTMKKGIIILIGIALVIGVVATGTYGLSQEDLAIYQQAVELEESGSNMGFEGFALTDYPVAFYDGDRDYVVTWEGDGYSVKKRRAVINFIAATAYPVDDHYEVLTPTIQKMSSLMGIMSAGGMGYGVEEHTATIWHEAFHCYQATYFPENMDVICSGEIDEGIIAGEADTNPQAVSLFQQQARLLEEAVKVEDVDRIRECIVRYKELDEERMLLLSKEVIALEDYYTRVEGTACYIEACIYKMLLPEQLDGRYLDGISEYSGGSSKYYRTGMAQCMILDRLNPNWKVGFDFSESVIDLIYRELGLV
ncbi:MAG: hypothetical protein HDR02_07445 [Lachnospiraceae bacterium]|nr:hypothetical protein [Lachnospiraceae bacterium]